MKLASIILLHSLSILSILKILYYEKFFLYYLNNKYCFYTFATNFKIIKIVDQSIVYAVITLGSISLFFSVLIYFVNQKFKVEEDPRIDEIQELLPGANCGGCGFAGCRNLAESIVKTGNIENLYCPVGGSDVAEAISAKLGIKAETTVPKIAVVRCNGSKKNAKPKTVYEGTQSCFFANLLYVGESGCSYGCLGLGDCVSSCIFDAIYMDKESGLPVVVEDKCTGCGLCVKACPRSIIELRKKGPKNRRIFVSCVNKEKGGIARKNCEVACIGCLKCQKICVFDAITIENNLAYIDFDKCTLCRKCVQECPTNSILEVNFPLRKEKTDAKQNAEVTL